MHWLLSVPETFSLREVVRRSKRLLHAPYHINAKDNELQRVEYLNTGLTLDLQLSQAPAGLVIQTAAHIAARQIEEVSQKVWRMLRLDDNLLPFRRTARRTDALVSVATLGARLLRGATLFEDAVVATVALRHSDGTLDYDQVAWIVDRFGAPFPSNPTLHAFPTPELLLDHPTILQDLVGSEVGARVHHAAEVFATDEQALNDLAHSSLPPQTLATELTRLLGLAPPALALLMLALGRYDYIPTDVWAREQVSRYQQTQAAEPQDVRRFFEPWQPWGGLAYWLWDWTKMPASHHLRMR